ncbi:MFS transporter [Corynebacterium lowii]|uniref:Major Facilitator Superfamily protein n=1 Tax=Corynebacterium lowii TaxID=1544413 RepID=A0A0Q0UFD9_9CORY|nr:MFS transporter [Corynebacterium lowii]KQB86739.1 Major Facilitator Superfamily protein [Corynebacterium lowii]MDP9851425.1 MFS family permease [Corynebacterium lowii]
MAPILLALLVVIFGTTMPTPLYGEYKHTYDLADWSITGIYAIYAAGIVAALIFLNGLSDWVGRRGALWVGLAVFLFADVLFILWPSEAGLYVARVVSGVAAGIYVGTATVAAVEVASGEIKAHAATYATAANVLGLGLGPVVAGVIVEYRPQAHVEVYLLHMCLVAVSALLLLLTPETHGRQPSGGFALPEMPRQGRGPFMGAVLVGLAGLAAFGLLAGLTQAFLLTIAGVSSALITGLVVGLAFITSGITQIALRGVSRQGGDCWWAAWPWCSAWSASCWLFRFPQCGFTSSGRRYAG